MKPTRPIFIGTFHKTGTVLMIGIFREIAKELGLEFQDAKETFWKQRPRPTFDIFCDRQSSFLNRPKFFGGDVRCCIVIRDPRDVVISAAGYHTDASEPWLHQPEEKFGGMTYQQALCDIPTEEERFLFEMDNSAARVIEKMLKVDRSDSRVLVTRLDDLIVDRELEEFRRIFTFLGFEREALDRCLAIARSRSIFSPGFKPRTHIRNTTPALWKSQFTPRLARAFEERFPGAAERLGYEPTFA